MSEIKFDVRRYKVPSMIGVSGDIIKHSPPITMVYESSFNAVAAELGAAQSELAALREELAQWKHMVGAVCATIPLAETLKATEAKPSMVQYFKGLHAERDNLRKYLTAAEQRNSELVEFLTELRVSAWHALPGPIIGKINAILKPTESGASE